VEALRDLQKQLRIQEATQNEVTIILPPLLRRLPLFSLLSMGALGAYITAKKAPCPSIQLFTRDVGIRHLPEFTLERRDLLFRPSGDVFKSTRNFSYKDF
jgi:hypothetical protein